MIEATFTCRALPDVARTLSEELRITAEFPEEEFAPYFPVFAAAFRHEFTNYDELLCRLPAVFAATGDEPSPDVLVCTCEHDDWEWECHNEEIAHQILKNATGRLGQPVYDRLHEKSLGHKLKR